MCVRDDPSKKFKILEFLRIERETTKMAFTMWTDNGNFDLDLTDPYDFLNFLILSRIQSIHTHTHFFNNSVTIDAKEIAVK